MTLKQLYGKTKHVQAEYVKAMAVAHYEVADALDVVGDQSNARKHRDQAAAFESEAVQLFQEARSSGYYGEQPPTLTVRYDGVDIPSEVSIS